MAEQSQELNNELAVYRELIERWSGAVNLFSRNGAKTLVERLVSQSLVCLPWLEDVGVLLDVGSGNGTPSVPILLAKRGLSGVLLEPRERRWAFLKEVVRELKLNAEVRRERLEQHNGTAYDVMTVRAVSPSIWLDRATTFIRPGGQLIWWKDQEIPGDLGKTPGLERVITCDTADRASSGLVIWRRCFT